MLRRRLKSLNLSVKRSKTIIATKQELNNLNVYVACTRVNTLITTPFRELICFNYNNQTQLIGAETPYVYHSNVKIILMPNEQDLAENSLCRCRKCGWIADIMVMF